MSGVQLLDMDAVNEARTMFRAKFPTMSSYYFEDAAGYVDNIRHAIAGQDVAAIVAPAHTLKSSSRQMGAVLISAIAKDLEQMAREQADTNVAWFAEQLSRLETAFDQTRAAYPAE